MLPGKMDPVRLFAFVFEIAFKFFALEQYNVLCLISVSMSFSNNFPGTCSPKLLFRQDDFSPLVCQDRNAVRGLSQVHRQSVQWVLNMQH